MVYKEEREKNGKKKAYRRNVLHQQVEDTTTF